LSSRRGGDATEHFRGSRVSVQSLPHPNLQTGACGRSSQCPMPGT
jgi:hypothetical protein